MNFKVYLKNNALYISLFIFITFLITTLLLLFSVNKSLIFIIFLILISFFLFIILYDYNIRKRFYNHIGENLKMLDQKYLILETVVEPTFLDGKIMCEMLYEIDKSYLENIHNIKKNMDDFKDYVEMWIHEVKLPISSLVLMCHNHKNEFDQKYLKQVNKIDKYLDQILYYARSNCAERDFLIKEVDIDDIVNKVLIKNKDDILEQNISVRVNLNEKKVHTDSKWLEFILNQIINNSIKYKDLKKESKIEIYSEVINNSINLVVYDNGIGIPNNDIDKVFNKSFTGANGRKNVNSTGFGLYIVKKLVDKLGHKIYVDSELNKYTKVIIEFGMNDLYKID